MLDFALAVQREKFLDIWSIFEYFIDLDIHVVKDHDESKVNPFKAWCYFSFWFCLIRSISCRIGRISMKIC